MNHPPKTRLEDLGDFTTTTRVIPISLMAIAIGVIMLTLWFMGK